MNDGAARDEFIALLAAVLRDREAQYGDAVIFFERLAKRWSLTLGVDVSPAQAVRLMIDFKLERLARQPVDCSRSGPGIEQKTPDVSPLINSIVDIAGYAGCFYFIADRAAQASQ